MRFLDHESGQGKRMDLIPDVVSVCGATCTEILVGLRNNYSGTSRLFAATIPSFIARVDSECPSSLPVTRIWKLLCIFLLEQLTPFVCDSFPKRSVVVLALRFYCSYRVPLGPIAYW